MDLDQLVRGLERGQVALSSGAADGRGIAFGEGLALAAGLVPRPGTAPEVAMELERLYDMCVSGLAEAHAGRGAKLGLVLSVVRTMDGYRSKKVPSPTLRPTWNTERSSLRVSDTPPWLKAVS